MSSAGATTADVSNKTFLIVSVTLTCIAALFVIARVIANWNKAKKHIDHVDDYVTVLALILLAASVAGYNKLILALLDPTMTIDNLMKLANALTWLGSLMLWGCKVPILLLYVKLFGVKPWVKISSYATIIVSGIVFLIMSSLVTDGCTGRIDTNFLPNCQRITTRAGFTLGMVSVITDAIIFVLPLPVILRLHLPLGRRIGIAFVFASGLGAIAASATSTHYKYDAMKWSTSTGTNAMICTIVECAVALIVACVPGVYSIWAHNIIGSGIYSRLSSAFSQVFHTRSGRSRSGASDSSIKSAKSRPSNGSHKMDTVSHHVYDIERGSEETR